MLLTYISYFVVIQLGITVGFSSQTASPPFSNHVVNVVPVGAEEEMIWTHADDIVADMANVFAGWNFSDVDYIADAMRQSIFPHITKCPVSIAVRATYPFPAMSGRANVFQKPQSHIHKPNSSHSINI